MRLMTRKGGEYCIGYIHRDKQDSIFVDSLAALLFKGDPKLGGIISTESATYLAYARNLIVNRFLNSSDCDWLLMLDDDMSFPADIFDRLHKHAGIGSTSRIPSQSIITALYFSFNRHNRMSCPMIADDNLNTIEQWNAEETIQIGACGAGCMLVHRHLFQAIDFPWFGYDNEPKQCGEDYWFSKKARKYGFTIYCDTSVVVEHAKGILIGESDIPSSRYL